MMIQNGLGFCAALADRLGLPKDRTEVVKLNTGIDQIFSVTLNIALTADDLAAIADSMPGRTRDALATGFVGQ